MKPILILTVPNDAILSEEEIAWVRAQCDEALASPWPVLILAGGWRAQVVRGWLTLNLSIRNPIPLTLMQRACLALLYGATVGAALALAALLVRLA